MDTKNCGQSEKKNRQRGNNWTQEEKDLFLKIMRQSASIIDNKQSDTNTNKKKYLEWLKVQSKLKELTGEHRGVMQLKGFWRRSKLLAKKKVSLHKRARATSGGHPAPSSQEDLTINNRYPTVFVAENDFDSDRDLDETEKNDEFANGNVKQNSTRYDIELNEDDDEIIKVTNINNVEVHIHKNTDAESNAERNNDKTKSHPQRTKYRKTENSHKGVLLSSDILKRRTREMSEERHALKIKYQKQELIHQKLRHKLEIDILLLEKERKELEIQKLKQS